MFGIIFPNITVIEVIATFLMTSAFFAGLGLLIGSREAKKRILGLMITGFFSHPLELGLSKSLWRTLDHTDLYWTFPGFIFFFPILVLFLFLENRQKLSYQRLNYMGIWQICWIIMMFMTSLAWILKTGDASAAYVLSGVLAFCLLCYLVVSKAEGSDLIWALESFSIIYFLIVWGYTFIFIAHHGLHNFRLISLSRGSESLGFYTCIFILVSVGVRGFLSSRRSSFLQILGFVTLLASGNRASLVLVTVGLIIISLHDKKFSRINMGKFIIRTICIISITSLFLFLGQKRVFSRDAPIQFLSSTERIFSGGIDIRKNPRYRVLWPLLIKAIVTNPFGTKGYPSAPDMPHRTYPHNMLLYVTYSGGVLAGSFFLLWLISLAIHMTHGWQPFTLRFALGLAVVGHLIKVELIRTPSAFTAYLLVIIMLEYLLVRGVQLGNHTRERYIP